MQLNSDTYDKLKWVALIGLPALASLYLGLGQLWEWPETDKVGTSIVLVDTFLGVLLGLSAAKYKNDPNNYDGMLTVVGRNEDTGLPDLELNVTKDPREMGAVARLRVDRPAV